MMKSTTVILTTIIYNLLILFSCKAPIKNDTFNGLGLKKDTISKEIQLDEDGQPDTWYGFTRQKAAQLELDSLQLGYDSLQIRIWFDYSLAKETHLIVIQRHNNNWSGKLVKMRIDSEAIPNFEKVVSKEVKSVSPKSGWDDFMKNLSDLKLNELRTSGEIGGADGVSYCIEIATMNSYRFSRFWSPEFDKDKNWQSANLVKIIQSLENEFGFKRNQQ